MLSPFWLAEKKLDVGSITRLEKHIHMIAWQQDGVSSGGHQLVSADNENHTGIGRESQLRKGRATNGEGRLYVKRGNFPVERMG